jgi:hypothetical protein
VNRSITLQTVADDSLVGVRSVVGEQPVVGCLGDFFVERTPATAQEIVALFDNLNPQCPGKAVTQLDVYRNVA